MVRLTEWTVDYGSGPVAWTVPHAWRQDVDVRWEGPAVYRCRFDVPNEGGWVTFEGISYSARVLVNGDLVGAHDGIWDAFAVSLASFSGREVEIQLEVVKNG